MELFDASTLIVYSSSPLHSHPTPPSFWRWHGKTDELWGTVHAFWSGLHGSFSTPRSHQSATNICGSPLINESHRRENPAKGFSQTVFWHTKSYFPTDPECRSSSVDFALQFSFKHYDPWSHLRLDTPINIHTSVTLDFHMFKINMSKNILITAVIYAVPTFMIICFYTIKNISALK